MMPWVRAGDVVELHWSQPPTEGEDKAMVCCILDLIKIKTEVKNEHKQVESRTTEQRVD